MARMTAGDVRVATEKLKFALKNGWMAMAAPQVDRLGRAQYEQQTGFCPDVDVELAAAQEPLAAFWQELDDRAEIALDLAQ